MIRAAIILAALAVAGCSVEAGPPPKPQPQIPHRVAGGTVASSPGRETKGVEVFTDPATGCEYLVLYDGAMVPRFEAGGENSHGSGLTRVRGCRR